MMEEATKTTSARSAVVTPQGNRKWEGAAADANIRPEKVHFDSQSFDDNVKTDD